LIIWIAGAALVAHFDFATEASWMTKAIVSGLALFSIATYFGWIPVRSLVGMILLLAVSIFIIFYRMIHDTRGGR
jgi:hypothetical protein